MYFAPNFPRRSENAVLSQTPTLNRRWPARIGVSAGTFPLRSFFPRYFRTFLASFREPNGNSLLAALHGSAFAPRARLQGALLLSTHCARYGLACGLPISSSLAFSRSAPTLCHDDLPLDLENLVVEEVGEFRSRPTSSGEDLSDGFFGSR